MCKNTFRSIKGFDLLGLITEAGNASWYQYQTSKYTEIISHRDLYIEFG